MKTVLPLLPFTAFMVAVSASGLYAQQDDTDTNSGPWKDGGSFGVNFNQVALSNWAGGGDNTLAVGGLVVLFANRVTESNNWDNSLEVAYGFTKVGEQDFRKSDDKLNLFSQFNLNETKQLLYSAILDFRTQLTEGVDHERIDSVTGEPTLISNTLAPGYLNVGAGVTFRPVEWFEAFVGPLSNRLILVFDEDLSDAGAFGVDSGTSVLSELGATSRLKLKKEVMENVTLGSQLKLFAPYDEIATVVVNWETLLTLTVNDYITTSISLDVIYDEKVDITRDDGTVGPSTQIKEALAVGFGYAW